jgi:hypothetical protein
MSPEERRCHLEKLAMSTALITYGELVRDLAKRLSQEDKELVVTTLTAIDVLLKETIGAHNQHA